MKKFSTKKALRLAELAEVYFDEHGPRGGTTSPGTTYRNTTAIDYVAPGRAAKKPYLDMGGEGLALILVTRKRNYRGSYAGQSSTRCSVYLVGKNEAGTYFSHAVPERCPSVLEAIKWIWGGRQDDILARQGDIALIKSTRRNLPKLPDGHKIDGDMIVHETHPPIRVPSKGEAIIIGRRSENTVVGETRD